MSSRIRFGSALFALCIAGSALAAPPAGHERLRPPETRDARSRYVEGAAAYHEGRFPDAVRLFREADAIEPSAALSFDIARAYDRIGDDAAALAAYRDYLRRAPSTPDDGPVQRRITLLASRLAAKGVQQVTVLSTPRGATITLDGDNVGVTPFTAEFFPGDHVVFLHLDGYRDEMRNVRLSNDTPAEVTATLVRETTRPAAPVTPAAFSAGPSAEVAVPRPEPAPPPPAKSGVAPATAIGWAALGAGAASLGGALVFEILRARAESDAQHEHEQVRLADDIETAKGRKTAARVLTGVGLGLAATGGAVLLFAPRGGQSHDAGPSVRLDLGPTRAGASFEERF